MIQNSFSFQFVDEKQFLNDFYQNKLWLKVAIRKENCYDLFKYGFTISLQMKRFPSYAPLQALVEAEV